MKLFISYSRSVQNTVREIIDSLRDSHENVWWDQDLRAGQDWWGTILEAIEACDVFVFMISEQSVQSPYCLAELRYALARNRLVLPYVVDAPLTYELPAEIISYRIQYELYRHNPEHFVSRLQTTCRQINWLQYQDCYATRPAEPSNGANDLIDQLDQALSLALKGYLDDAVSELNTIMHNAYAEYGEFCRNWIELITHYREIAKLASKPTMKSLAVPKWTAFTQHYGLDFDPLGVSEMLFSDEDTQPARPVSSPNAPYAPPARPPVQIDVYAVIRQFQAAYDQQDWEKAAAILQDIRESGLRIPRVFNIDAYEQEVQGYLESVTRDQDYQLIRSMMRMKTPNYRLINEALREFWERYPDYDPDNLRESKTLFAHAWFDSAEHLPPDDHPSRIQAYSEAIHHKPDFCEAYVGRGNSYHALKDYEKAVIDFTKAILLNPTYLEAYSGRGYSFAELHQRDLAIKDFTSVLQLNPKYRYANRIRGLIDMLMEPSRGVGRGA